ncbi:hypothetical protein E2C01_059094 [Portunus trituberculatus]|uniref:Uncharacterized protein n=1 Tax=Portunus trituberculatus TaxID=210409 RepID=A0A5B7GX70_PORTR|nr:hypothetical protein [Portunus trituberculatus]
MERFEKPLSNAGRQCYSKLCLPPRQHPGNTSHLPTPVLSHHSSPSSPPQLTRQPSLTPPSSS